MVAQCCKAVIACRARKDQKAKLTRLVRKGNREVVTLGVGDGANDVEMIRAAHIGVGIIGKEGTQAVNKKESGTFDSRDLPYCCSGTAQNLCKYFRDSVSDHLYPGGAAGSGGGLLGL